jgi:GNAT superfamily N-acetyltransferase
MTFTVQTLDDGARGALVAHLLALPAEDLRQRFGRAIAPEVVAAYVERIDFARDAVFGVRDISRRLIAAAHVAVVDDLAEIGLSVLPAYRGRGWGGALFGRAAAYARIRSIPKVLMHFLWGNTPIVRIARRFGMRVVARAGEADACLDLTSPALARLTA